MSRMISMPVVDYPWRRWFAWRPVKLIDGKHAWWCEVERRNVWFVVMTTEYRKGSSEDEGQKDGRPDRLENESKLKSPNRETGRG